MSINTNFMKIKINASKTIDDSLDNASYFPKPIEETELADSLNKEIDTYVIDNTYEKNSLNYWKNHKDDLPNLSQYLRLV